VKSDSLPLTLVRVGHHAGRGGGAASVVHRSGLVLASALAMLAVWAVLSVDAVAAGRHERLAARAPVPAASATDPKAAVWYAESDNQYAGRQFSVVAIAPLRPEAPLPPGLSRWPQAGEVFLSPALADLGGPSVKQRFGHFAGLIGRDGLSEPTELFVYYRPASGVGVEAAPNGYIKGFGTPEVSYTWISEADNRAWFGSGQESGQLAEIRFLLLFSLVLPVVALLLAAARSGAERRDARLSLLDALGAARAARGWVLVGEAALPTVVGVGIGSVLAVMTTLVDLKVPVSGYIIAHGDLAPLLWALPVIAVIVMAGVIGLTLAASLRRRGEKGRTRPKVVLMRARRWPWAVLILGIVVMVRGAFVGNSPAGRITFFVGLALTLLTLPVLTGWIAAEIGKAIAAFGHRRGRPSALVGGAWLAARPSAIARVTSVFVLGLGLASQIQVATTIIGNPDAAPRHGSHYLLDIVTRDVARDAPRLAAAIGAERVLLVSNDVQREIIDPQRPNTTRVKIVTTIAGSCTALKNFGTLKSCPTTPTQLGEAYASFTTPGTALGRTVFPDGPDSVFVTTNAVASPSSRMLVINNDEGRGVDLITRTAYDTLLTPVVSVLDEQVLYTAAQVEMRIGWVLGIGLLGMAVLILTGGLSASIVFVAQGRELGPVASYRADRGLFYAMALWNLAIPLAVSALIGAAVAAIMGRLLIMLEKMGTFSVPFLGMTLSIVTAAAILVGLACGEAAVRSARSWRPAAD
jgi:hypothetical protein